jgi:hypothetical protein
MNESSGAGGQIGAEQLITCEHRRIVVGSLHSCWARAQLIAREQFCIDRLGAASPWGCPGCGYVRLVSAKRAKVLTFCDVSIGEIARSDLKVRNCLVLVGSPPRFHNP